MASLTASQLRSDLASTLNKVAFGGERINLQRSNKDVAAIISMEDLALLRELEDRLDLAEMKKAMEEPGEDIPWEAVKRELEA